MGGATPAGPAWAKKGSVMRDLGPSLSTGTAIGRTPQAYVPTNAKATREEDLGNSAYEGY